MSRFGSFILGGFECSVIRRSDGVLRDLLAETAHVEHAEQDYRRLADLGIRGARDGFRWSLIDRGGRSFDWSSVTRQIDAASEAGVRVIWDLCHYDCPDDVDIWSDSFVDRFAAYCAASVQFIQEQAPAPCLVCPINEVSYWAWAGGAVGLFHPSVRDRAPALKTQLVKAFIAGARAIRETAPNVTIVTAEPLISVHSTELESGVGFHEAQFEACDMIIGRSRAELGGDPKLVDCMGLNYYPHNQWYINAGSIPFGHQHYTALSTLLEFVWRRYRKTMFIAETAAHGSTKPHWLSYVLDEVRYAASKGVPVEGVCLYPVVSFPDWFTHEIHDAGVWSAANSDGFRPMDRRFADLVTTLTSSTNE